MSKPVIMSEQARLHYPAKCDMPHIIEWCQWYLLHTHVPTSAQTRACIAVYQLGQHLRWSSVCDHMYHDYQSVMSGALHWLMTGLQVDKDMAVDVYLRWSKDYGDPFVLDTPIKSINYRGLYSMTAEIIQMIIDLQRPFTQTRRARFSPEKMCMCVFNMVTSLCSYVPERTRYTCIKGECEVMSGKL